MKAWAEAEGICRTCVHIYCIYRDRGVQCTDYERGVSNEVSEKLERNDGDLSDRRKQGSDAPEGP